MKHVVKVLALVVASTVLWIGLLQTSVISHSYTWMVGSYYYMLEFYFLFDLSDNV